MKYLAVEEIAVLNARIIEATGGSQGVRDANLLHSLIERPKTKFGGKFMYRTVFERAATYYDSLIHYHVFLDGNKRTALASAARFLHLNGYELTVSNKEAVRFTLHVATQKPEVQEIAAWLKRHTPSAKG